MGVRGELFSTKVALQNRTYFFNVKENRLGDLYLNIVESKNRDEGGFERQSIILFAEDLQEFLSGFDESLKVLERAVREKRKGSPKKDGPPRRRDDDSQPRSERRFEESGFGESRFPPREEKPPRRERPTRPHSTGFDRDEAPARRRSSRDDLPPRRRAGREDREERGEAPRRSGGEYRPHRTSATGSTFREKSSFREREKPAHRGEGRPRREERTRESRPREPRDGYRNKDKPSFGPKKRVVVRKR